MRVKIYIPGGAILSGDITEEATKHMTKWFQGEGGDIYLLNDNGVQRLIHRNNISIIEFS